MSESGVVTTRRRMPFALPGWRICLPYGRKLAGVGPCGILRGAFGVLDSGRSDVSFENHDGHQVDRKMLELLVSN